LFAPALRRIPADSETGEFRVGDVLEVLTEAGHRVATWQHDAPGDLAVVDDRVSLADAEAEIRRRTNTAWMRRGVSMVDPDRTYIDATVKLSVDVTLFPGSMLQGATVVGPGAEIGPDTRLIDCAVGRGAVVERTVGREAEIGDGARVGPFAVLDPGTHIAAATVTGPFYHASSDAQPED
jgi:bifunctional UDP-N-acetylglucosamine pyrophosphorylase/glucosamine-1-phosphate N-acetyltransferase